MRPELIAAAEDVSKTQRAAIAITSAVLHMAGQRRPSPEMATALLGAMEAQALAAVAMTTLIDEMAKHIVEGQPNQSKDLCQILN
jgi:hypothetical protein